ncbi:MAG: GAF domain-containing protein [Magnetococcales bacterium]|nr:GAF domain-containing protein [Magnetococcales bacterium]
MTTSHAMNRFAALIIAHSRLFWSLALLGILLLILVVSGISREQREAGRFALLNLQAQRMQIDLLAQTLNGPLIGSLNLLGLIDPLCKRDVQQPLFSSDPALLQTLENIGTTLAVNGLYLVDRRGIIHTFWGVGKSLTGVDVLFRPYVQMALQGKAAVYAAVGTTSGERTLFFAAPLQEGNTPHTPIIGVIAARMNLFRIDRLLANHPDIALLVSPQGLVFASNHPEWIAHLTVLPTPERLQAIRTLKQFGTLFDQRNPEPFPFDVSQEIGTWQGNRYAIARMDVQWHDPSGNWQLLLLENLDRSIPLQESVQIGLAAGTVATLLVILMFHVLHSHQQQQAIHHNLQQLAQAQAASANRKAQRAALSLRLQQCCTSHEAARLFLQATYEHFGTLQGVIYLWENDSQPSLQLAASFACQEQPPSRLLPGEGVLGQCCLEKKSRLIEQAEEPFLTIHSGLGESRPRALLLIPILWHESLQGVLEVALLHKPAESEWEQLQEMVALLAMNLQLRRQHVGNRETEGSATMESGVC